MKRIIIAAVTTTAILFAAQTMASDHYVTGHMRSNGTYVQGHYQSNPNKTQRDNYGTRGNYNPYTGKRGTKNPKY